MSYVVLARKYRPRRFEEVVGQEPIARTLKNAITSERVAHAYLFTGPRGVGKTSMARILAMALNCQSTDGPTPDPCGKCASCTGIFIGEDVDVREIDGASNNGVEDVRTLRDNAGYHPAHSRYKIYIIDEVHMLSKGAFNALLKTLEEPPEHVKFIFATTEAHKLPDTVHSRCQRFDFRNIATADIVKRLTQICKAEKVKAPETLLAQIARRAKGGMRDAQSLLDQVMAYAADAITDEAISFVLGSSFDEEIDRLLDAIRAKDAAAAIGVVHDLIVAGQDLTEFLGQLLEGLRTLMVTKACGDGKEKLLDLPAERIAALATFAEAFSMDSILYMLQVVAEADRKARTAVEKRIVVESTVVKLAGMEDLRPLDEILRRLRETPTAAAPPSRPAPQPARATRSRAHPQQPPTPEPPPREVPPVSTLEQPSTPTPPVHEVKASGPLGEIQAAWPRLLALIKTKHQRSIAAFLQEARATDLTDDTLTLSFTPKFTFHRDQLAANDRLAFVETCLAEVVGRAIRITLADAAPAAAGAPKEGAVEAGKRAAGRVSAAKEPGVRRAVEFFGGRVVEDGN